MNPLSLLYGTATHLRNLLYDTGLLSAELKGPVISVGSISAGGAGKTPLVLLLGELLKQRNIPFDVLSRGYGRKSKGVRLVDAAGEATEFGDEPLLIARRLGVPVIVGENRYHAGIFAEHKFGAQMHLLDDGFQHRALARDFDVVALTLVDLTDRLLPAGRLREPTSSLARADIIAFSLNTETPPSKHGKGIIHWPIVNPNLHRCWTFRRKTVLPAALPRRPIAFCGIARPHNFFGDIASADVLAADKVAFPDHHSYSQQDIQKLLSLRDAKGAEGFITTEKDAINLGPRVAALQPLAIARVDLELENADRAVTDMLGVVSARLRARS